MNYCTNFYTMTLTSIIVNFQGGVSADPDRDVNQTFANKLLISRRLAVAFLQQGLGPSRISESRPRLHPFLRSEIGLRSRTVSDRISKRSGVWAGDETTVQSPLS